MKDRPEKGNAPGCRSPGASSEANPVQKESIVSNSKAQGAAALSFNSTTFDVVAREGERWLQAADIARALGYAREDSISRIYDRRSDEFTAAMSQTVKLTVKGFGNGNSEKSVRIFSLRGAHLLAMFARTPVAKAFRKWVLDVLDREVASKTAEPVGALTLTDCGDKAKVSKFLVSARKRAAQHLARLDKEIATWELVDEERKAPAIPASQIEEISTRLDRVGKLFHPFSDQFADLLAIKRALRGQDPRAGFKNEGWMEILPAQQPSAQGAAA